MDDRELNKRLPLDGQSMEYLINEIAYELGIIDEEGTILSREERELAPTGEEDQPQDKKPVRFGQKKD